MTLTQVAPQLDARKAGALRYLPILKARRGELKALESLDGPVGADLTPVIELIEDFEGLDRAEVDAQLDKLVAKIVKAWPAGRPRIVVDTFAIELDAEVSAWTIHGEAIEPELVTGPLLDRIRTAGVRAVPVIRLSDQPGYTESLVERVSRDPEPGACLRISGEDLDDTVVPLDQAVEEMLDEYELDPAHVDLILDFGAVTDDNTLAMASRLAKFVLPSLDRQPWRSFSLGSGAFPVNLTEVSAYSIAEIPRRDRQLWMQLRNVRLRRPLDYSDYAVTHPDLQTGRCVRCTPSAPIHSPRALDRDEGSPHGPTRAQAVLRSLRTAPCRTAGRHRAGKPVVGRSTDPRRRELRWPGPRS